MLVYSLATDREIKELRPVIIEYKEHLQALKDGEPFEPILTAPKDEEAEESSSKKRKRGGGGRKAKRHRGDGGEDDGMDLDDDDDFINDRDEDEDDDADTDAEDAMVEDVLNLDDVIDIDSDSDDIVVLSDSDDPDASQSKKKGKTKKSAEPVTQESLKEIIAKKDTEHKALRQRLAEQKKARQEAVAKLNEYKKTSSKLQKDKNGFCSIKRNEVCALVAV